MPFEDAAVLPLATSTAACALFQSDQLGLRPPSPDPQPAGQTVLVWGGSTSVGSNAIQLAVAAGYQVITTASPRNFDYVRSLGAAQAFDYNSPGVEADIIAALQDRTLAGAIAIGTTSAPACVRIAGACPGSKFVSVATPPVSFVTLADGTRGRFEFPRLILRLVATNLALQLSSRSHGIRIKYIWGTTLKSNQVSTQIYQDFLPAALASGRYVAAPKPSVLGHGVHDLQWAMDIQLKGVSATKVVVSLP